MNVAIKYKTPLPTFSAEQLEAIAKVLADTSEGLTGSQIEHILSQCKIPDLEPMSTKWKRLFNALISFQNEHQVGNHVIMFITRAMDPVKYTSDTDSYARRRDVLIPILALCGMTIGDDGKVLKAHKAGTLNEAVNRANRFQAQLRQRNVHDDILRFCSAEILSQNYFHAVFEAMKSITAKIRQLSGLDLDGHQLVDEAFKFEKNTMPRLCINPFQTETQRGEQRGFVNLLKGLLGTIRNPLAHDPKIEWDMNEQDALDIMTTISLVHRKLDRASRRESCSVSATNINDTKQRK
jgi:uncharacterized protein (TIGR02391 family)